MNFSQPTIRSSVFPSSVSSDIVSSCCSVLFSHFSPPSDFSLTAEFLSVDSPAQRPQSCRLALLSCSDVPGLKKIPAAGPRLYVLISLGFSLFFREVECFRPDFDSEPLLAVNFNMKISCHAVRKASESRPCTAALLASGFDSGAVLIYSPFQEVAASFASAGPPGDQKKNANGEINQSRVNAIEWIGEDKIISAHADGRIYVFDLELASEAPLALPEAGEFPELLSATRAGVNPIMAMAFSPFSAVTALSFSPNGKFLAVAHQNGWLALVGFSSLTLVAAFQSFYGAFLCLAWQEDSSYLIAGSEDDLISLFDISCRNLAARFEGHKSWVSSVLFLSGPPGICRFLSASQDGEILFWEFQQSRVRVATKIAPVILEAPPRSAVRIFTPSSRNLAHQRGVCQVSSHGEFLVSLCAGGILKLWTNKNHQSKEEKRDGENQKTPGG